MAIDVGSASGRQRRYRRLRRAGDCGEREAAESGRLGRVGDCRPLAICLAPAIFAVWKYGPKVTRSSSFSREAVNQK